MSWNAAPGALNIDIKVTLVARLRQLGLAADALPYLRLVAGPRYHAGRDEVRFSSQAHGTATANKRQVSGQWVVLSCALLSPLRLLTHTLHAHAHTLCRC